MREKGQDYGVSDEPRSVTDDVAVSVSTSPIGHREITITESVIHTYTLDEDEYRNTFEDCDAEFASTDNADAAMEIRIYEWIVEDYDTLTPFESGDVDKDGDLTVEVARKCKLHPDSTVTRFYGDKCWDCANSKAAAQVAALSATREQTTQAVATSDAGAKPDKPNHPQTPTPKVEDSVVEVGGEREVAVFEGEIACEEITRQSGCYGCGGSGFDQVILDGKPLSEIEVLGDSLDWWFKGGRSIYGRPGIEDGKYTLHARIVLTLKPAANTNTSETK